MSNRNSGSNNNVKFADQEGVGIEQQPTTTEGVTKVPRKYGEDWHRFKISTY